jgi:hypothetical protein
VGINHDGVAAFAKFAAIMRFSLRANGNTRKYSGATPLGAGFYFNCSHNKAIVPPGAG